MKILIAYDGSGISRSMLDNLQISGLPEQADAFIISVSEIWMPPQMVNQKSPQPVDSDIAEYFKQHSEQMKRNLSETTEILHGAEKQLQKHFPNWNIETKATDGSPAQQILLKADEFNPDLILIGEQGLSWDGIRRLGNISQKVLTESKCSVRIGKTKRDSDTRNLKIVVCYDGSKGSLKAVETVASRHWQSDPEIRLITVTDPLVALIPGRAFQVIPGIPEERMKGEINWIESLAKEAIRILSDAGHDASLKIYSGNPRLVLPNETDAWGADLVFIGANSNPSQKDSLGSIALAVAVRTSCTIEVLK